MTELTWNNNTGRYEAHEDGKLIEVDGDAFAEALADAQKDGMSYDEAFAELSQTLPWTLSTPMDGVYVDGKYQG